MKFLITFTLTILTALQVKAVDGVDPNPSSIPIVASNQQKLDLEKIITILKQNLPQTSKG